MAAKKSSRKLTHLQNLPEDLKIHIFELCDPLSICRLRQTCKMFRDLIDAEDLIWRPSSRNLFGSNASSPEMLKRCQPIFSYKRRHKLSYEWKTNLGESNILLRCRRCMPWIIMEREYLFVSIESDIIKFPRDGNGNIFVLELIARRALPTKHDDVTKFVVNKNELVIAGSFGTLCRLKKSDLKPIHLVNAHLQAVPAIDARDDIIITGSRDEFVKIWKASSDDTVNVKEIKMKTRVLSTAIMPNKEFFIVGLPGVKGIHPLQYFDLERGNVICKFGNHRAGAGILQIVPENHHSFLTCGYDTTVRLWDVRTPEDCVATWIEPFDNTIYCVKSDYTVTMVTGAHRNGVIHMWDKRCFHPRKAYHIRPHGDTHDSSVYAIDFDMSHLYCALDQSISEFSYI